MPIEITVPRLGWTMEEGTFVAWIKQEGELVRAGDPLFTLESEKAAQEIEATDAGILHVSPDGPKPGSTVRVGTVLGYLVEEDEPPPPGKAVENQAAAPVAAVPASNATERTAAPPVSKAQPPRSEGRLARRSISPRARRMAAELGMDWTQLNGTGRAGRIREHDVRAAMTRLASSGPPAPSQASQDHLSGHWVPISPTRRTIARRMLAGLNEAAPVTLTCRAEATHLFRAREQGKAAAAVSGHVPPTFTDFFVKLSAAALQQHPSLTAQWREDGIFIPDQINIAIAVETDHGLLAPVVRDVPALTIEQVAAASRTLIEQARAGRLPGEDLRGGTFTVTNLGRWGIDTFTPIIHLPQCAVLGVGCISREPVVVGDEILPREVVSLSLTFDHRVVDGAPAARFLETLRRCLADPAHWITP